MKRLSFLLLLVLFSCTKDPVMYDVTVSATEGGTVSPQSGSFEEGSSLTLIATPSAEYEFTKWSNGSTQNPLVLTVTSDLILQAEFTKKQYDLKITLEGVGTVIEKVINTGKGYDSGTKVELTAVPAGEWVFAGWSGDITSNDNPLQVTISSPKNIKAKFVKRNYPLTVNIEGQGTVTEEIVNTGRTTEYDSGTTVRLTAQASEGWEFFGWSGAISGVANPQQLLISGSKELTVEFKRLNPIYLDENGVTIKAYDWANVGDIGWINGVEYTIVDEATLRQMVANDEDVSKVVTTRVKNMFQLFFNKNTFNQNISNWDTSNVIDMSGMFQSASEFNQDIGKWELKNVNRIAFMFYGASNFNQNIGNWDISNINSMTAMFQNASSFNKPLNNWDISNVYRATNMFCNAISFNQPLNFWNTSNLIFLNNMFDGAASFNQDISNWCVPKVIYIPWGFSNNSALSEMQIPSWTSCTNDPGFIGKTLSISFHLDKYNSEGVVLKYELQNTYISSITIFQVDVLFNGVKNNEFSINESQELINNITANSSSMMGIGGDIPITNYTSIETIELKVYWEKENIQGIESKIWKK